ncbi:MAG TPA: type II secretion system F family protein [Dehalococcoidia bacterium]|jgi:tight adherence protein C|nr:type II secretion system F family protein [Dehalococcoidia bacterium]
MAGLDPLAFGSAAAIFGMVVFFVLGVTARAGGSMARQRLESFKRGPIDLEPEIEAPGFGARMVSPLLHVATRGLSGLLPKSMLAGVERKLVAAGEPMNLQGFLTMVIVATIAAMGFGLLIMFVMAQQIGPMQIGIFFVLAFLGFYMPFYIVNSRAKQRQHAIIKSLPDAFDLITTCVEAGLGLDAALSRVAEKVQGPFAQELSRSLREIALGKTRRDALKELGDRTQVPDLMQFTNAVIQAEAMGSSIGQVLRVQSDQLRVRRRQRAEEQAYKAPVKMLFPLVMCIFPTLFIVILGPAIITIKNGFG